MTLINRTFIILLISAVLVVTMSMLFQHFALKKQLEKDLRQSLRDEKSRIAMHFTSGDSIAYRDAREIGYLVSPSGQGCNDTFFHQAAEQGKMFMVYQTCILTAGNRVPVRIMADMTDAIEFRKRYLHLHLYTLMSIVLAFITVKLIAFNNIWSQFKKSLELLKKRELHTRKVEFPSSSIREINELNQELNDLSVFLNREYHSQKEFIENLSHELFTPIANVRGKLELLVQSENLKEKDIKLIAKALDGLDRLIRVNRSLIIMTKVENSQDIQKQDFNINDIVDQSLDLFEDQIRLHGLNVTKKSKDSTLIHANKDLIEILVVNLLRNAILHNVDDGMIEIHIAGPVMSIRNTGKAQSLRTDQIFRRFSSDSVYSQSVGLGLAISRRICEAMDIGITYSYSDGIHAFTLNFGKITA